MIIAIDGPLAAGKGTIARAIAARFGWPYLDTGLLYRAVGMQLVRQGLSPDDEIAAIAAANNLDFGAIEADGLRSLEAGAAASRIAIIPAVRAALLAFQRHFARHSKGAVLDGRDIGTVVCPDADVKIFVTASVAARAKRRHAELQQAGQTDDYETVLRALHERDARDQARDTAPLRPANDAIILDTTDLTAEQAVEQVASLIEPRLRQARNRQSGAA